MKEQILHDLDRLKSIDITVKERNKIITEVKRYVRRSTFNTKTIDIDWLRKTIMEDVYNRKCDGLIYEKINYYINKYEQD